MATYTKLTFISCCGDEKETLEFLASVPTNYINGATYYYNNKCYIVYLVGVAAFTPPPLNNEPTLGGEIPEIPLDNTAYLLAEGNDCDNRLCPDCDQVNHPEHCYYVENCFDPTLNFITVISNPGEIELGNTYSLDLSNIYVQQSTLCIQNFEITHPDITTVDNSIYIPTINTGVISLNLYNGKPYYTFTITPAEHGVAGLMFIFYIIWNSIDNRWEAWQNFDILSGPSCNDCCANVPFLILDAENPFTTISDSWASVGSCNTTKVNGIRSSFNCLGTSELPIDFNNCWTITPSDLCEPTSTEIEITTVYESCEDCGILEVPPCFLLIDCNTGEEFIYSGDVLNEYINRVIQVNIEGVIRCFSVQVTPCTEESLELVFEYIILDCFDINECLLCLPKPEPIKTPTLRYVQPGYDTALCDPNKVEKIKCTFADLMYQQAMSRRFNIKFCCPKDLGLWQLRNEKIILDLTKFINPTPDSCNPICKTYAYEFAEGASGSIAYLNCSSVDVTVNVLESTEVQRFEFCALDYPGVTISITNSLGVVVDTFTIQPIEAICIV